MPISKIYSRRRHELRNDVSEVYQYDEIPTALRVQIVQIVTDALGDDNEYRDDYLETPNSTYNYIAKALSREYGIFNLVGGSQATKDRRSELMTFILREPTADRVLDAVEFCFRAIDIVSRSREYLSRDNYNEIADEALAELNERFKQHGVGYEFVNGLVMRVDSQLIHSEVVKPALKLLMRPGFEGPQQEFFSAFEHFRNGKKEESLVDCLKAFESTMRVICDRRGWSYPPTSNAHGLIDTCLKNGLIPTFWQSEFTSLRTLLEGGIPTVRNKLGGHGKGSEKRIIPDYLNAYALHLTASTLVFLMNAEGALP